MTFVGSILVLKPVKLTTESIEKPQKPVNRFGVNTIVKSDFCLRSFRLLWYFLSQKSIEMPRLLLCIGYLKKTTTNKGGPCKSKEVLLALVHCFMAFHRYFIIMTVLNPFVTEVKKTSKNRFNHFLHPLAEKQSQPHSMGTTTNPGLGNFKISFSFFMKD